MGSFEEVIKALDDKKKFVVCQLAPSVRVTIGEEFGYPPGAIITKKLVGALKLAGFDKILDTSTGADIVTVEEGTELLERLEENQRLPLFTSCCPLAVAFVENAFPQYVKHFCTVKSPQQSIGALIKTHYARRLKLKRENIYSVSIMPCNAKKMEARRPEMEFNKVPHVDAVLTAREAVRLLKERKIDLSSAKETNFDQVLGSGSGAGQIFGTTGGTTEALLRFISSQLEGKNSRIDFPQIRGMGGFRESEIIVGGKKIRVAIVDGLNNLGAVLASQERMHKFDIIEVMTCPGGCIGGSEQPAATPKIIEARRNALFAIDAAEKIRSPMDNPAVKNIYKNYFGEPLSQASESVLHVKRIGLKCE